MLQWMKNCFKLKSVSPLEVTGLTIGYPCKSLSPQNSDPKAFTDADSTSGGGFKALLDYVDYNPHLEWVVTENVKRLCQKRAQFGGEVPIDIQNKAMQERGFFPAHSLICTSSYGIPQSRSRCWGIYIKKTCLKAWAPDPHYLFQSLTLAPVPTSKVLDASLSCNSEKPSKKSSGDKWRGTFKALKEQHGKATWEKTCYNL